MKKSILTFTLILMALMAGQAQSPPQAFSYQALVRDGAGAAVRSQVVGVRIRLHQDSMAGAVVYSETHAPTTNGFGNINLAIGRGTPVSGTFSSLNWSSPMFIEIGVDETGGTSYKDIGTSQLLSVPYALYSGQTAPSNLGQSSINYFATGYTYVTSADTAYRVVQGLSRTITVPAGMTTLLQTTGVAVGNIFSAWAHLWVGLFVDGVLVGPGGETRVYVVTDDNRSSGGGNWHIIYPRNLSAGSHTIAVMVKGHFQSETSLTTDTNAVLNVTFLKN